ncbi:MAG: WecB/TagA/CpsF family glycosyltransferase [Acidiferrobacterales bacterium]|nr:WecB/TagA/CpsF family glycosyltransferase [Acidiferrobacterales bacterium]
MNEQEFDKPPVISVCGFHVSSGDLDDHVNLIDTWVAAKQGAWIVTINTEMLARAGSDSSYRELLMSADLFVADGMPIVWSANRKTGVSKIRGRTTGVDLVERLLTREQIIPFGVIGGVDPEMTLTQYPGALSSCKYLYDGIVDLSEKAVENYAREIDLSGARILLLALGVPKQDKLAIEFRKRLPEVIIAGVGGTMEILSSNKNRSPLWMQNMGLEWLFRFAREPKRLWKRYLLRYPVGIFYLLSDLMSRGKN